MLQLFNTIFGLLLEMAPYLLLGFFIAGFLHILIPSDKIYQHLSGNRLSSIIKAAVFGVPLPICSCGVIPVSAYIRKEGAGKGATVSFLSSTPTSGVDSILATYALLGPVYAVIRPIAAFFSGILSGSITGILERKSKDKTAQKKPAQSDHCVQCTSPLSKKETFFSKIKSGLSYGFDELLQDTGRLILIGVVIGGLISFLVPEGFIQRYLGNPWLAYPVMLLVSIPMYICATGSIPIAASLIMEGMAPGAGLVFLIAGPATNTTTIAFITGKLGKKYTAAYIFSIIVTAVLFGLLLDMSWNYLGYDLTAQQGGMTMFPYWLKLSAAILLLLLIARIYIKPLFSKKVNKEIFQKMYKEYKVADMSCTHCVNSIKECLQDVQGVDDIRISLDDKEVFIKGEFEENAVLAAMAEAGYTAEPSEE